MTTPVRHIDCGAIVMWYVGKPGSDEARSRDVIYLDGARPQFGEALPNCPSCGARLSIDSAYTRSNIRRCFDEDIDPGPAVLAAIAADNAARTVNL